MNKLVRQLLAASFAAILVFGLAACDTSKSPEPSSPSAASQAASVPSSAPASAASSAPAAAEHQATFYFIAFFENCSFCTAVTNGATQAGKDFGVDVKVVLPGDVTADKQNPAMLAAVAAKPDAIAFPYFSKANEPAVAAAIDAGIPVVLYNNNRFEEINNDPSTATTDSRITSLAYVGQDETTVGDKLVIAMLPSMKPNGHVLIINNAPNASVLQLRQAGMIRQLDAHGMTHDVLEATMDETQNVPTITAYLAAHPDVDAILALGDPASSAAAKVLKDQGKTLPIGTIDVDTSTINYIKDGSVTAAINQQPWLQGYGSVWDMYLKVVLGLSPVDINTGTQVVTKDNVADLEKSMTAGMN